MKPRFADPVALRAHRNRKIYRSLFRITRVYNRWLVEQLHARGFRDFSPAYPPLLANLDSEGSRIGALAQRAGVTRQAAGQLLVEIEAAGYVSTRPDPEDGRATVVAFTGKGTRMLATVLELVEEYEAGFARFAPAAEVERVEATLAAIADGVDPDGALRQG